MALIDGVALGSTLGVEDGRSLGMAERLGAEEGAPLGVPEGESLG